MIPRLTAETVPDEAEGLLDELVAMLPRVPLAALFVELDRRFSRPKSIAVASAGRDPASG